MSGLESIFKIFIFLDLIALFGLFFMKGRIVSKKVFFYVIALYTFVICVLLFDSKSGSGFINKFMGVLFGGIGVFSITSFEKDFFKSRVMLAIALVGSSLILFLF